MSDYKQKVNTLNEILNVQQLSVFEHNRQLLHELSLQVVQGAFHCIIGESGSGKSLLTRTILGMRRSNLTYQGTIDFDLTKADAVFQDVQSNMFQNVRLEKHFQYLHEVSHSDLTWTAQKSEILTMMERLGLAKGEQLLKRYPFELSGGMAQRIAFIMSLIRRPDYLILDEPTSALDRDNNRKFMDYLSEVMRRRQMTVIFVTHDLNLVKAHATHISIVKDGNIIETGEVTRILEHPHHAYTEQLISIASRRQGYASS